MTTRSACEFFPWKWKRPECSDYWLKIIGFETVEEEHLILCEITGWGCMNSRLNLKNDLDAMYHNGNEQTSSSNHLYLLKFKWILIEVFL